jgi:hypothetical protein
VERGSDGGTDAREGDVAVGGSGDIDDGVDRGASGESGEIPFGVVFAFGAVPGFGDVGGADEGPSAIPGGTFSSTAVSDSDVSSSSSGIEG